MQIRVNADTPEQARSAREAGIRGIGLCRPESMLLNPERSKWMHSIAGASGEADRRNAISTLLPLHQADLEAIFTAMSPYPAFIRLLDPPLEYLLPTLDQINADASEALSNEDWDEFTAMTSMKQQLAAVSAFNPLMGNRGCRLSVTNPESMTMQVKAILQAAIAVERQGTPSEPAIVIPLVCTEQEGQMLAGWVRDIATEVFIRQNYEIAYKVGVLIEVPRAALCAGEIARHVDFVCFGTNDLTQMTFGFSREDSHAYLRSYLELGILKEDPFVKLDIEGVGRLLSWAIDDIRRVRPEMEIGVCGDHCGDDAALRFFESLGASFVACDLSCIDRLRQTLAV